MGDIRDLLISAYDAIGGKPPTSKVTSLPVQLRKGAVPMEGGGAAAGTLNADGSKYEGISPQLQAGFQAAGLDRDGGYGNEPQRIAPAVPVEPAPIPFGGDQVNDPSKTARHPLTGEPMRPQDLAALLVELRRRR